MNDKSMFSRRELALLGRNIGLASLAAAMPAWAAPANAAAARARLGYFASANQQNYARAAGSMQKAMGANAEVEFVGVNSGPQILTAMAADGLDLCNIGSSPMIVAFAKGLPVSMVYVHKIIKDSEALIVRGDSGVKSLGDLKGRKIACPFNTSAHFALLAALKTVGLSAADVTLVNLRADAIPAAWQRRDVDAAYIWFPILEVLQRDGGKQIFDGSDLIAKGTIVFDSIIVRDAFKKQHPDLVLAYLKELDRINAVYRDKPEEMAEVMAPFLQISRDTALAYAKTLYTVSPKEMLTDTWMGAPGATASGVLNTIRGQADFLKATGQVDAMPADFSKFVDSSFIARMV